MGVISRRAEARDLYFKKVFGNEMGGRVIIIKKTNLNALNILQLRLFKNTKL